LNERTIRLFITDELPDNVSAMKSAIRAMNKASGAIKELYDGERKETDRCGYFVVRDYSGKVTKVMDELILEAGAAKNFLIPYSSKDRHLEILAACNEGFRFAGASERLLCLIESLCGDLGVRKPESRFKSAYSAAEKGKTLYTADHQIRYLPPRARNAKKYRQLS